jgi:large subunit ribosomal protein L3
MINGIIGRKIGMTQIFATDGTVTPVTVIKAGPCVVVQKKSAAGPDGYDAVQVGLVDERPLKLKNVTKPMRGHFEKTGGGIPPTRILKEFRLLDGGDNPNVGDKILVDQFADGEMVDVIGRSKGSGFRGHGQAPPLQSRTGVAWFDERARAGFDWRVCLSLACSSRETVRQVTWAMPASRPKV